MAGPKRILLPLDVIDFVFDVFEKATDRVADRLDRMPTVHEEALDLALIDALSEARGPHVTSSGVVVDLDVHFLGGGHHWERWEIADIGVIVNFRRGGQLLRTKVVLLQSKRLYPREVEFVEDLGLVKPGGFGWLMNPSVAAASGPRSFRFDSDCRYKALQVGDEQWQAISEYEATFRLPVHYLLYHPRSLPTESVIPVSVPVRKRRGTSPVGVRVVSAPDLRNKVIGRPRNHAPSYGELKTPGEKAVGIRLPEFMAHDVLRCRQGYVVDPTGMDPGLARVFNQRSAPIAAAIRLEIDMGEGVDVEQ